MSAEEKQPTAVGLFSGGLDSLLALKLVCDLGVRVTALHLVLPVQPGGGDEPEYLERRALELGAAEFRSHDPGAAFLEIVRQPQYGYGKNANPCLDCRLLALRTAGELMEELGVDFVFTGEVLGERPMSQRGDALRRLEKLAGLEGRLLRPLSAKLLPETEAERAGLIERERLLDLRGRGRKRQFELAAAWGIGDYPSPAGGCLLTTPGYADRIRDALEHDDLGRDDFELFRHGRLLRLPGGAKLSLGRNKADNAALAGAARPGDLLLDTPYPAPLGLLRRGDGEPATADVELAARCLAGYSKCPADCAVLVRRVTAAGATDLTTLTVEPLDKFAPGLRELLV